MRVSRPWSVVSKSIFGLAPCALLLALCSSAHTQQPGKIPRIGYLTAATPSGMKPRTDAFRLGLRELGYVEGNNIILEWRYAEGKSDRLSALIAELVQLKVEIIVSAGPGVTVVIKQATSTIPIVMAQDNDPVGNGFVASLARPGGNITGLSTVEPELSGKRLELLKEVIPRIARVAVFGTSTNPGNVQGFREIERAAEAFGIKLQYLDIRSSKDGETAFRAASKARADAALFNVLGPIFQPNRKEFIDLAIKHRLPVMYENLGYVRDGGLMFYGIDLPDLDRRAAAYVDKILKGRKPADLPVEQPTKFEFVINLKAAKQISLTIPPNVLARADRVIK